jgi:hypothetical protein
MKTLTIEGTIDVIGEAMKRPGGKVYSVMSFLTRSGGEVFLRNVCVDTELDDELELGSTGRFVIGKSIFQTSLQSVQIGVFG